MKKIGFFVLLIATGILIFVRCSDNQSINTDKEKTFADFKQTLSSDILFNDILASAKELDDYVADPRTKINISLDIDRYRKKLAKVKKRDTQMVVLSDLTNRPEEYFAIIKKKYKLQQEFILKNPGFLKLSESEQKELISYVVSEKMLDITGKSNNGDTISSGPCEDQLRIDEGGCRHQAYAAAAFCGLLAPTLLGAAGCGVAVLVADGICHHTAQQSYGNCIIHEQEDQ